MEVVKKYATALFGLAIFILAIQAIRTSGLVEAVFAPEVEAGNLSSVDATWFLTVAESAIGFVFTWAVFFFVRLGESGFSFWRTFFGFKASEAKQATKQTANDINADMRALYAAVTAKRNAVVSQADADIQAAIAKAISETTEQVSK